MCGDVGIISSLALQFARKDSNVMFVGYNRAIHKEG